MKDEGNLFELECSLPGHFYEIAVPKGRPVTYMTGPNGYGKTTILKQLHEFGKDGPSLVRPMSRARYEDSGGTACLDGGSLDDGRLVRVRTVLLPFQDMTGSGIDAALAKAMAPVVLDPNSVLNVEDKAKRLAGLMDKYMEGVHAMELLPGKYIMFRNPAGGMTTHEELSIGERKLLLLLWTIVFDDGTDVLYLIDSPDEGMHIEWHMELSKDLPALMEDKRSHAFVATHSPHLINACWRTSIDLYELEHPKNRRDDDD